VGPGDAPAAWGVGAAAHPTVLAFEVELRRGLPPTGAAVLVNRGGAPVRIWADGTSFGDEALSFEAVIAGRTERITRMPRVYTVNPAAAVPIPPGVRLGISFDLGDGTWEPEAVIDILRRAGALLMAVYTVPDSAEAVRLGVWSGVLRSAPVRTGCRSIDGDTL
jgi:hypothetical protein